MSVTCDRSVVFSGYTGYYTNKTDRHDITETLLKVALNTINQTPTLNTDQKLSKVDDRLNASVKHNFMDTSIKSRFLYFNSFSKWKSRFCLVLIDNDILFSLMALVLYSIIKLWLSILPAVGRYRCWWTDIVYSVRFYLQLFVGGLLSYLRYSCLFAYSGVQHILWCVFVCFSSSSCLPYVAIFSVSERECRVGWVLWP